MEILVPMLRNGSFIHSFTHTHSSFRQQPAPPCNCWRRFLDIGYICRAERRFLPANKGVSGLWSLQDRMVQAKSPLSALQRHLSSCMLWRGETQTSRYFLHLKILPQIPYKRCISEQLSYHPFSALSGASQWEVLVSALFLWVQIMLEYNQ